MMYLTQSLVIITTFSSAVLSARINLLPAEPSCVADNCLRQLRSEPAASSYCNGLLSVPVLAIPSANASVYTNTSTSISVSTSQLPSNASSNIAPAVPSGVNPSTFVKRTLSRTISPQAVTAPAKNTLPEFASKCQGNGNTGSRLLSACSCIIGATSTTGTPVNALPVGPTNPVNQPTATPPRRGHSPPA